MVLKVHFVLPRGINVDAEVPGETIVEDVLKDLIEAGLIDPLGFDKAWLMKFEENGKVLDGAGPMDENGITDGTVLRVVEAWIPGRAAEGTGKNAGNSEEEQIRELNVHFVLPNAVDIKVRLPGETIVEDVL